MIVGKRVFSDSLGYPLGYSRARGVGRYFHVGEKKKQVN